MSMFTLEPLSGSFGARVTRNTQNVHAWVSALEAAQSDLLTPLVEAGGLLLLSDMQSISAEPELLVRISRLFGPHVEDYRQTLTGSHRIHVDVPEILLVTNKQPTNQQPPKQPDPPTAEDGSLPLQFPHRRGWHTDQSYRRPPPDVSLFYAHEPITAKQGQTLYANGIAAYAALSDDLKAQIDNRQGLHVMPWTRYSEDAVRNGEEPMPLLPHQQPQPQPVVRTHPVSGQKALYLCESGQMDWINGPLVGLEPGIHGSGAQLLYKIMSHYTHPDFVYAHHWSAGDLVIYDNRCTIHAATWFDATRYEREMWRTTVSGNPGPLYDGESPSWIPKDADDAERMRGIENV